MFTRAILEEVIRLFFSGFTFVVHLARINMRIALIVVNALATLTVLVTVLFPLEILRIVLGLPFVLFFPGFTLISALFPKREWLNNMERVVLSFGISIATVTLIGFILNFTPWGLQLEAVLYSVASFTIITSIIAWIRLR